MAEERDWDPPKVDKSVVEAWLTTKWKENLACPICKDKSWLIGEHFISLSTPPGPLPLRTLTYPSIQLICTDCGYVLLFNWGVILHGKKDASHVER